MITIAVTSGKGGTGKTTLTFNLGYLLSESYKVLMIDSDPQMSLSLACKVDNPPTTLADVINHTSPNKIIQSAILQITDKLHILPSSLRLSGIEAGLGNRTAGDLVLKRALNEIKKDYDYCLIDAPPHLAKLSVNILTASDGVIIPVIPDTLSIQAVGALLSSIDEVQQTLNPELVILGLLINQHSEQSKHHKEALQAIKGAEIPVFEATIGKTIKFAEAMSRGLPLHKYDPQNPRIQELKQIIKELWKIQKTS